MHVPTVDRRPAAPYLPDVMSAALVALVLALLVGMRHALEPDHLAAVSTLVTQRRGAWRCAAVGASWGVGHAVGIAAIAALAWVAEANLPARLYPALELGVAVMLVVLGIRSILRARVEVAGTPQRHAHLLGEHEHGGPANHVHVGQWTLLRGPLLVGMAHGLAGSGALLAVAVTQLPTPAWRMAYLGCSVAGSVVGMAAVAAAAGWSLQRVQASAWLPRLTAASGVMSLATGVAWCRDPLAILLG